MAEYKVQRYSSKTGAGTINGAAKELGISVQDLLAQNKDNAGVYYAGTDPRVKEGTVLRYASTTPASDTTTAPTDTSSTDSTATTPVTPNKNIGFTSRMDYSTDPNGVRVDVDPVTGLDVNAPGSTGKSKVSRYTNPYDEAAASYYDNLKTSFTETDASALREAKRKAMQSQIDQVTKEAATKREDQVLENAQNSGRIRALQSNAGTIGSGRGLTDTTEGEKYNQKQLQRIEDEKTAKINAILTDIEDKASQEIEAQRLEAKGNNEAKLNFMKTAVDDAKKNVADLAALGVTQDQLDPKDIEDLLRHTGYDKLTLDALWNAKLPDSMKTQYQTVQSPGENGTTLVTRVGYNPRTKKTEKETYTLDVPYDSIATKELKEIDGVLYSVDPKTGTAKALTQPSESKMLENENKRLQNQKLTKELDAFDTSDIPEKVLTKVQASPEYKTINGVLPAIQAIKDYRDAVEKYGTSEIWSGTGKGTKNATYGNAIAAWKTLAGLGALSGADFGLAENVIPKGGGAGFKRNSVQITQLDTALNNAVQQAETLTTRLKKVYPQAGSLLDSQLADIKTTGGTTAAPAKGATTVMTSPDGTQYDVPNENVEVFKQNGYK